MSKVLEKEIQKWLENNYGKLSNIIKNSEVISNIENEEEGIPYYSLDFLIEKKILKSAKYVFDNLYLVDLVVADKNISIQKGEQLYPDLLLFNPETNTFIIVEIKRSILAEREAITELLAYEHELQNLFPFMSKLEVCFVLIAADFKPLLEHSIYSLALWQNRKILPLKIDGLESNNWDDWNLSIHIPDSWSLLSLGNFISHQISTVNFVLYDKDAYNHNINIKEKEDNIEILYRGLELIIKEGEKHNSNGFVLLSRLTHSPLANWNITIGVINPYSFLELLEYESKIKDYLKDNYDIFSLQTKCTTDLVVNAKKYLKVFYNPEFETFSTWETCRRELENISMPIKIDFFGEIDNIINDFVLNEKVRKYYYPELNQNNIDWKVPLVGLNLLDNLFADNIFYDGVFNYFSIYKFGKIIGKIYNSLLNIKANKELLKNENFRGKYAWIELEFIKSYREVGQRYMATDDIKLNLVAYLPINSENIDINIKNIDDIIEWFTESFITDDVNKRALHLGTLICCFYENRDLYSKEDIKHVENIVIETTEQMINKDFEINELVQYQLTSELNEYKKILKIDNLDDYSKVNKSLLIDMFEDITLPLFSRSVMDVFHSLPDIDMSFVDYKSLKNMYKKEYMKNNRCLISSRQNGNLVFVIAPEDMFVPWTTINPEEELLFWNDKSGGLHVVSRLKWEEFEKK